ncbi:molybdenum cofactor guanylyltransferase MobA [Rhodopila sp.]|uniref:molybdenum cofactor guanylyltransferase MobA n=1 Tax=Rhodopila sp. TaxID=2480087 RepID=UPI003D0D6397
MFRIGAVILAGGQARRMGGGDKTLLTLGDQPMLAAVIKVLDVPAVAISANGDPARFARFGLPVLPDGMFAGEGPLAGVLAGLNWAASVGMTALLTVPGDTPFLPEGLAKRLVPAPRCAASGGRRHHLVSLWPVACRKHLSQILSVPGRRDVASFAALIGMRYIDFPVRSPDPFANVNTPDDLAQARSILGGLYNTPPGID